MCAMQHFQLKQLANSNLMQACTESLIRFGWPGPNYWH